MKLKSVLSLMAICFMLSGCYHYNPENKMEQRTEKLAQKQATEGCLLLDSHEAYRRCLITTALNKSPKTFTTTECENGQAIAIIKSNHPCSGTCNTMVTTEITRTIEMEPIEEQTVSQPASETVVVTKTTEVVAPAVEATPAQEPKKDPTWWEQYQANKQPQTTTLKCPCEDPNDPCPHCVEK